MNPSTSLRAGADRGREKQNANPIVKCGKALKENGRWHDYHLYPRLHNWAMHRIWTPLVGVAFVLFTTFFVVPEHRTRYVSLAVFVFLLFAAIGWLLSNWEFGKQIRLRTGNKPMTLIFVGILGAVASICAWLLTEPKSEPKESAKGESSTTSTPRQSIVGSPGAIQAGRDVIISPPPVSSSKPNIRPFFGNLRERANELSKDLFAFIPERNKYRPEIKDKMTHNQIMEALQGWEQSTKGLFLQSLLGRAIQIQKDFAKHELKDEILDGIMTEMQKVRMDDAETKVSLNSIEIMAEKFKSLADALPKH